jgi:holo-[acyl-carrier protein] synthase
VNEVRGHRDKDRKYGACASEINGIIEARTKGTQAEACASGGESLIVGMGIDVAEVERIRRAIERHGEVFLQRIFTAKEREYCERFKKKFERYAGRFAVKEAAMKALGTGWSRGVRWVDLEVVRQKGGRPTLVLTGEARKIADQLGVEHMALSITHTAAQAFAQVIFEN